MGGTGHQPKLRLDKWLVHARFTKTRGQAAALVHKGGARINGRKAEKPDAGVRVGDVLTLALPRGVLAVRVLALGERRGSPADASTLYRDIAPRSASMPDAAAPDAIAGLDASI
jgi:ribosome-associated heat shock protein Hsp15